MSSSPEMDEIFQKLGVRLSERLYINQMMFLHEVIHGVPCGPTLAMVDYSVPGAVPRVFFMFPRKPGRSHVKAIMESVYGDRLEPLDTEYNQITVRGEIETMYPQFLADDYVRRTVRDVIRNQKLVYNETKDLLNKIQKGSK